MKNIEAMLGLNNIEAVLGIEVPRDLRAEQSVMGSILMDSSVFETVNDILIGGEFFDEANKRIYRAMKKLGKDEIPIDPTSLAGQLQDSEELDAIGGITYLLQLVRSVPSSENAGHYAERVREMFLRRETIETVCDLLSSAAEGQDVPIFVSKAETAIAKLSDQTTSDSEYKLVSDVMMDVLEHSEMLFVNRHINRGVTGIRSCWDDLDRLTAGFQDGDLIIVAARPSVGKTAFALNIGQNVAVKIGEFVAIFSLEMSARQLGKRMVCAEGNIDANRMRTGFFEEDDWLKMSSAISSLSASSMIIDDSPGITVREIRAKCRKIKKKHGLGLVVIDYLQLIQGKARGSNRQEEVAEISRTLKHLALELGVPVIALSQLSRAVEQRQDKRPMLSDLRESGSIEQDADIVAFLYRDDYYNAESEKKNIIEINIAKQRNGPTGTVELAFLKNYNKFVSLEGTGGSAS